MVRERRDPSGGPIPRNAHERLPQATFNILPGVGHVPMIDDPDLVARTILAVTGAGTKSA